MPNGNKTTDLDALHKKYDTVMTDLESIRKKVPKLGLISATLIELVTALSNYELTENARRVAHANAQETKDRIEWFLYAFISNQRVSAQYYRLDNTNFDWSKMNHHNYEQVIHQFWREYPAYKGKYQGIIDFANNGVNEILNDYDHYTLSQSAVEMAPLSIVGSLATVAIAYTLPYFKANRERKKLRYEINKLEDELFWNR